LVLGQNIAFLGRGEAALRGPAQLIESDEFRRLVDPALDLIFVLERAGLGRDQPDTVLPLGTKRNGSKLPARALSYSMK
jgi:hypothetical protein